MDSKSMANSRGGERRGRLGKLRSFALSLVCVSTILATVGLLATPSAGPAGASTSQTAPSTSPNSTSSAKGAHDTPSPTSTSSPLSALQSEYATTTIAANGLHKTAFSSTPVNYKDASGNWEAINSALTATASGGWHNTANSVSLQLPSELSSPVSLSNGGASGIAFTLVGANHVSANAGTVSGSTAAYPDALADTSVSEQAAPSGVKETLSLAAAGAPSTFTWDLSLASGLSAVAAGAGIDINGSSGTVAQIAAPTVTDASGATGSASYALNAAGNVLTLTMDPTWLSAPGRAFPVTVDPSITYLSTANGCTINSGSPTTASCSSTDLGVGVSGGSAQRALVHFPAMSDGTIPVDAQVEDAWLSLPVDTLSGSVTLNAYPLTRAYSNSAVTWNSYDGTHAWTTAGGDYASTPTVSGSVPSSGTFTMDVPTATAQSWVDGSAANDGFLLKASNESTGTNLADFIPSDTYGDFLDVYWTPNTGVASGYPLVSHTLDDHLSLGVNAANGNLIVHATDLSINGAAGQNEVVDRYYNSENGTVYGAMDDGWDLGEGPGVFLEVNSDNVTAFLPGGQPAVFMDNGASWTTPPGVDAVLTEPTSGHYALTLNQTQEVIDFTVQSSCSNGDIPETSVADRNGETLTYAYSSTCDANGEAFLSTITDTEGRVTTFSNNGSYYSGFSDPQTPTARTVTYTGSYTAQLGQTVDTSGNHTYYTYSSTTAGAQMTQIEDPNGNYTVIAYNGSGQVSSLTYVTNVGAKTGPTYTFAYYPGTTSSPNSGYTTVTDPNGHVTTYYYNSDLQTGATDGNGNSRTGTYNADNQPSTLTDAMTPAGVTNLAYDAKENLTEAEAPANGTDTAATSYANYQLTSGPTGYAYLPSSSVDAQSGCSVLSYDANGNVTNTYSGEASVSGAGEGGDPGCSSTTTYLGHSSAGYEGDAGVSCTNAKTGEVCWTKDADGNQTNYAYDAAGDLASVTPPSPQGATTYTDDSLSRVASVTNGDGNTGTPGTIETVQSATTNMGSSGVSSQTTTLPNNTTKGDTVVVIVGTNPVSPVVSVSSITGGGVGTWHLGKADSNTSVGDEEIWYGYANTGGSNSITVNMSAGTTEIGTVAIELTGVASSSPLDVSGSTSGSSATVSSPSLTTTAAGDLVIDAANTYNAISASPSSPWVDYAGPDSGGYFNPVTTRVVSATGAYSTSWSQSPTSSWLTVGIALKPAAETTSYTYDAMDRVTQILFGGDAACIPSSGNCITYAYDADGNLTSQVDNTGTTTFTYDALNRLIDKGTPGGADACSGSSPAGITYTYDGASNLTTSCDALGTTHYYYDAGNRLTSQVEPGGTSGCAVSTHTTETGCTAYSYDNDNRLLVTQFPGGATQTSTWTTNSNMASIVGANSSGTTQTSFVYTYAVGTQDESLVQTRVENDPSVSSATTVTYGYNTENELTSAVTTGGSSSTLDYYYDAAGNRCSAAATGTPAVCPTGTNYYAYNADNELTAGPTGSYTYDGAGNQTTSPQLSNLTYNSKNQNSSTTPSGGGAVASAYAGTDSTERTTDGSTTLISGNLGIDQSVTSGTTTYFIRNNTGTPIGEHVGSTSYYYLHDNEGSIVAVISASGTVQDRDAYDPYGKITSSSGSVSNPLGYAGGYTDSATGLVKFGTRYYNPGIGLFTQEDPSSETAGYIYAGDDPVNGTDPTGTSTESVGLTIFLVGIGIAAGGGILLAGVGAIASLLEAGEAVSIIGIAGIGVGTVVAGIGATVASIGSDIASIF
jgi:RHS repeat-associated protein